MGLKLCVHPGCLAATLSARCAEHERLHQAARNRQPGRKPRRTRAYMDTPLGTMCVCCRATQDLTRHHVVPLNGGGFRAAPPHEPRTYLLVTMCRPCNSSIGTKTMTDSRCPMHGGMEA